VRALGDQLVGERDLRARLTKTTEDKEMLEQWQEFRV
jgi:hypothetical protein